jgi:hypothetical protein
MDYTSFWEGTRNVTCCLEEFTDQHSFWIIAHMHLLTRVSLYVLE